jgi:hypothetical protein
VLFLFKCVLASKVGLRHLSWNNSGGSATFFPRVACSSGEPAWPPDTVRCTSDSLVHRRLVQVWLDSAKLLQSDFSRFGKVPST